MNFKFKIWIFDYQFVPDHSKRFQTFPNHNKQNNLFSAPVFLILAATTLFILIIGTFALMHYHRKQLFKIKQNRLVKKTFLEYKTRISGNLKTVKIVRRQYELSFVSFILKI